MITRKVARCPGSRPSWPWPCAPHLGGPGHGLRAPSDLAGQVLIHDDTLAGLGRAGGPAWGWPQWLHAGLMRPGKAVGRHFSNAVMSIQAAVAGQGLALAARELVSAQVAAGTLIAPFDITITAPCSYFLVSNPSEATRPGVAEFRQWLVARKRPTPPA